MSALALLLWTLSLSAGPYADLATAAAASGRPDECRPAAAGEGTQGTSIWDRAQVPGLVRYCTAIARGQSRLGFDPAGARGAAEQADAALPGRAAPLVLRAQAALAAGDLEAAGADFERAIRLDPHAIEQPLALHAWATLLRRTGQLDRALSAYRVLVPRAELLPTRDDRARCLLEAAHVRMALAGAGDGPEHLDEAMAYLREAQRDTYHGYRVDVALSLALALDRAGRASLADAVVAELPSSVRWAERRPTPYLARPADELALRALALHANRPGDAARLWRRYLATAEPSTTARRAAEARLERLERGAEPLRRRRRR